MKRLPIISAVSVFMALALSSCYSLYNADVQHGAVNKYKAGYPQVNFNAVGFLDENNHPVLNLAAAINLSYKSLIYKFGADSIKARFIIGALIVNPDNPDSVEYHVGRKVTIGKKNIWAVDNQSYYRYQKRVQAAPGQYKINFMVKDLNSGRTTTRTVRTSIPNPRTDKMVLTNIRMLGKNMSLKHPHWRPITTYGVPGRIDSLLFRVRVKNDTSHAPLTVVGSLVRFYSDTSAARPIDYPQYSQSAIGYRGIVLDDKTTLRKTRRKLMKPGKSVSIEYRFRLPRRHGSYRFEVHEFKGRKKLHKARDFGVWSKDFPELDSPREMARPLIYLMSKKKYRRMMAISDPDSLFHAVINFWLGHIKNKSKAYQTLEMYYKRAEQANKKFSNFKEGWKTDRGMIYILFGRPLYVNNKLFDTNPAPMTNLFNINPHSPNTTHNPFNTNPNSFGTNANLFNTNPNSFGTNSNPFSINSNPFNANANSFNSFGIENREGGMSWRYPGYFFFFFMQPRMRTKFFPFDHFVFSARSFKEFELEYQQRQLWLTGFILTQLGRIKI